MDITHFNPRQQDEASFLANFVARQKELRFFLKQIDQTALNQTPTAHLVVAPRGYGKTSLLRRISIAICSQPELAARFIALGFREEQHNILSLDIFWHNCLRSLQEAREIEQASEAELLELEALGDAHPVRAALPRDAQDGAPAWYALLEKCRQMQRRPILLIDNLDSLLLGLPSDHQWQLRRVLQSADGPLWIAASSMYPASVADHKAAFYDFFRIHNLTKLADAEVMSCLAHIAGHRGELGKRVLEQLQSNQGRVAALNTLAGGNPRTLGVLYKVLESHMTDDILSQLGQMLDVFTGWYQARTEELPSQARAVFDAVALHWDPITANKLTDITGLDVQAISSQLNRLEKSGHIEAVKLTSKGTGRNAYQVAERFFNVWYLMRNGSLRAGKRVRFLTAFLQALFSTVERKKMARDLLQGEKLSSHYALALSHSLNDTRLKTRLLSHIEESCQTDEAGLEIAKLAKQERMRLPTSQSTRSPQKNLGTPSAEAVLHFNKAFNLAETGRFQEAEAAYRQAITVDTKYAEPWNNLGNLLQDNLNRFGEAEAAYRQAIALDAKNAYPWNNLGNLLHYDLNRFEEAEEAYRQASALDATLTYPLHGLGSLLKNHLNRFEEAEAAYRQAIALDAKDADPWNSLGNLLQDHLNRYEEAEAAYRQAIALDAKDAYPWNGLGNLLQYHLNRSEEAEAAYRQAITLNPELAYTWNGLGNLLRYHLNRFEEAEAAYRKAISLDATVAYPWLNLADLLKVHLNRFEEAESAYRQCIALDAKDAEPWDELGNLLQYHLNRFEEAEAAYLQATNLTSDSDFWMNIGNLRMDDMGQCQAAQEAYKAGLAIAPTDVYLHANFAYCLALSGDDSQAATMHAKLAIKSEENSPAGQNLLQALPSFWSQPKAWHESWNSIKAAITSGDPNLYTHFPEDLQRLLSWMVKNGQGNWLLQEMQTERLHDEHAPLYHAVKALTIGADHLLSINPETRTPTQKIYERMVRMMPSWKKIA